MYRCLLAEELQPPAISTRRTVMIRWRFWGNLFRAEIARDLRSKHEDTFAQRLPECLTATEQGGSYGRAVMRLVARATVKL